jgi:hypothetical protein
MSDEEIPMSCAVTVVFGVYDLALLSALLVLTGREANLRARTGSVSGVTAVDVEDMTGDE